MKERHPSNWLKRFFNLVGMGIVGFAFLAIFTYTSQVAFSHASSPKSITPSPLAASPMLPASTLQPTALPKVTDYHAVLLLERAADLMVAYIEKVKAGEIVPGDTAARQPYTLVFPLAVEAYNQAEPSPGMESSWDKVVRVATAYSAVYPVLQQGKPLSTNDFFALQTYRQFLFNYQSQLEAILSTRGYDQGYFTSEHQAVDRLLAEAYGSTPMPDVSP
jgi:hypothetical protein